MNVRISWLPKALSAYQERTCSMKVGTYVDRQYVIWLSVWQWSGMWRRVFVYFPLFPQFLQLHGQQHLEENEDKTSRIFDTSRATHKWPGVTVRRLQQLRPQNVQFRLTEACLYLFRSTGSPSVLLHCAALIQTSKRSHLNVLSIEPSAGNCR